jgi:hypothetical protein
MYDVPFSCCLFLLTMSPFPADVPFSCSDHRYNAACAAALAGCGQGADGADLTPARRAALRAKALGWLRADLDVWRKQAASANFDDRKAPAQKLARVKKGDIQH